jgi:hypothetical protein
MEEKTTKTQTGLIILSCVSTLVFAYPCRATVFEWKQIPQEDVEYGVTALVEGVPILNPTTLETGYSGAYWWGNPIYGLEFTGIAQTFTVPSLRTLQSIQLRVGSFNYDQPSGPFEVSIFKFDSLSGSPVEELAAISANAEDYLFELNSVPVSSFDFSSYNLTLDPTETYALTVTPTATFGGGLLTLQSATDIYPDGSAYFLGKSPASPAPVPEPSAMWLLVSGIAGLIGFRRRVLHS